MSDCPRVITREAMIAGLKAGKAIFVDRRDAPELPELLELESQGLVKSKLVEFDEQSSALRFRWTPMTKPILPAYLEEQFKDVDWELTAQTDQKPFVSHVQNNAESTTVFYNNGMHETFLKQEQGGEQGHLVDVFARADKVWFRSLNCAIFFAGVMNGGLKLE